MKEKLWVRIPVYLLSKLKLCLFFLLLNCFCIPQLRGQEIQIIRGIIVDETGSPLPGVSVVVKNSVNGSMADLYGKYSITKVPSNAILVFSTIGYLSQEISVDSREEINVTMKENVRSFDEVVVTALGIKREKKALGYAMQEIKTDNFAEIRSENVANMLQGKIAGVQIAQSASGTGGSTRVVMRGLGSLSGNNQPLWVVDGIPIDDTSNNSYNQWGGNDVAGSASEINPEDIESLSVLKGPNAAALYGSRAQSGVIVVTTKKAKQGQPLSVQYNGNFSLTKIYDGYNFQWDYGQGDGGVYDIESKNSWGPKMTGQMIDNWRDFYYGESNGQYAMTAQKDRINNFFRTGTNLSNTVSIQGGGDRIASRFSYTNSKIEGVTSNNNIYRNYFDMNTSYIYNKFTATIKATYTNQKTEGRVALGQYGLMQMFTKMPSNIRLSDLENAFQIDNTPMNWSGASNEYLNPYTFTTNKRQDPEKRNRLTGVITAKYQFVNWFSVTARSGLDYIQDHNVFLGLKSVSGDNPVYSLTDSSIKEVNYDIMANFNKTLGDFSITSNVGAALMNKQKSSLSGSSGYLVVYGFNNLSNGSSQTASDYSYQKEIQSLLGNAQIGYKNMVYLDVTARNDWSSTLPKNSRSYFYPSASVSGIISEMVKLPSFIPFFKVRASWAQVGNDTEPYRLYKTYTFGKINGNIVNATTGTTMSFSNLKPEETTSKEVGADIRLFNNRVGLDFTYYNASTINQIIPISMSPSSGYSTKYLNAGKINSSGVEIMLNVTPVETTDWKWDLNLNWGTNTTKCVTLSENLKRYTLGSMNIASVVVDEGSKYGDIISKAFVRNENGDILIDDNGLPITESDKKIGNMLPCWTGSIGNEVRFKDFTFNALIDIRYGGDILSVTDALASQVGTSTHTVEGRAGMVVPGIVKSTGLANAKEITAETYWQAVGGPYAVGEAFIYDATYIKVRELSLGYVIPKRILNKLKVIKNARVSIYGRDLFYLKKDTPGTNPEGASSRDDWSQAFELNSLPPSRNFGMNVSLTF